MTNVLTLTKQQTVFTSLHFRKVKFHNTPVTLFKSFCTVFFKFLKLCIILNLLQSNNPYVSKECNNATG